MSAPWIEGDKVWWLHVTGIGRYIIYIHNNKPIDAYFVAEGSAVGNTCISPLVLREMRVEEAKEAIEALIPPIYRLLWEIPRDNLIKNPDDFLVPWKTHERLHYRTQGTLPGVGSFIILCIHGIYSVNFRSEGGPYYITYEPPKEIETDLNKVKQWAEDTFIPPLFKLLYRVKENPTRKRTFTPSYPADSQEEYEQKVRTGKKRLGHVQIQGGRRAVAGRDEKIPGLSAESKTRLVQRLPPWEARTQDPKSHQRAQERHFLAEKKPVRLANEIASAIEQFRKNDPMGHTGFAVPRTIEPLLSAGMPYKAADILVRRARGAFFPAVQKTTIQELFRPTLRSKITQALGVPLGIRYDGKLVVPKPGQQQPTEVEKFILYYDDKQRVILNAQTIAESYEKYREELEDSYRRERDDPKYLDQVFLLLDSRTKPHLGKVGVRLEIETRYRGKREITGFSLTEHSTLGQEQDFSSEIEYRSLRNVDLQSLPQLLTSLSLRKRRKGRKLQEL